MNDLTEQVMKGWQARQPSPGLRKRIFVSNAQAETAWTRRPADVAALMRWLVPAMGCFVIVTGIAMDPARPMPIGANGPLGGQQMAYSMSSGRSDWVNKNSVPAKSWEWTCGRPSSSSGDSFVGSDTNTLHK